MSPTHVDELRGSLRAEPCACGGWVAADPDYPMEGVQQHQASEAHRCWRMRGGMVQIDLWWADRGLLVENNSSRLWTTSDDTALIEDVSHARIRAQNVAQRGPARVFRRVIVDDTDETTSTLGGASQSAYRGRPVTVAARP